MRTQLRVLALALAVPLAAAAFARPQIYKQMAGTIVPELSQAKLLGHANGSDQLLLTFNLQPRFPDELQAFADAVSDPKSPTYRHFMTPAQVGEAFGASATDVDAVVDFVKANGMKIDLVMPQRLSVVVKTTVAQAEKALRTTINNYKGPDLSGKEITFRANSKALSLPVGISSVVIYVEGVSNYYRPKPMSTTLTPFLVQRLYNSIPLFNGGYQGQGMKIGYSNWDGWKLSNAVKYVTYYGLPVPGGGAGSNVHDRIVGGGLQGQNGAGEGDLDLQMQLAVAPLAEIYVYDNNSGNLTAVLSAEASDNYDIISESWGWGGGNFTTAHNIHLSMTSQGMTYMCASGDSGAGGVNGTYYYPGNDPEVLGVGGTVATCNTGTGQRISEVGWSGSGGGWKNNSESWNHLPAWQKGNGVRQDIDKRLQPDIASHSSATNGAYYIWYNNVQYGVSGTSCAAPDMTGALATVEQKLKANGQPYRLGRIQDLIYSMNGRSDVWYDITVGNNGTLPNGQSSVCTQYWDTVTGWGAPNWDGLYNAIAAVAQTILADSYNLDHGKYVSGGLSDLNGSDNSFLRLQPLYSVGGLAPPIQVTIKGTAPGTNPSSLKVKVESRSDTTQVAQKIEAYDFQANAYVTVNTSQEQTSDFVTEVTLYTPARFIQAGTNVVQMRLSYQPTGLIINLPWNIWLDQTVWTYTP